jgi:hypothetical protein
MNKYNIEGGIDFFAELYKSLDIEENEEKTEEDKNRCLISNELLTDKHITLNCGHKFNYKPLYYDIMNHKKKFNYLEGKNGKLNVNEIRCPYCRTKQSGVIPYYEELGLEKINGVNFYDPTIKYQQYCSNLLNHKCEFLTLNEKYNPNEPESNENQKFLQLCIYNGSQILLYNEEKPSEPLTFGDSNYYCYSHKKLMIKKYKKIRKDKEKEEAKEKMKELKAIFKQQKLLEKQKQKNKEKEEKQKEKELKKLIKNTNINENIVIGQITLEQGCTQILKTGPNKGKQCGCKAVANNFCKRHSKNIIIN